MKLSPYVLSPLGLTLIAFSGAMYWGYGLASNPDVGTALGVGVLFGLALVGIFQAAYRDMLNDQDAVIEGLLRLLYGGRTPTETTGED